jgi:hypothetical protein
MQIHSSIPELAKHEKTRRRRRGAFTTVAAGLLCLGLAAPASAGGEFKDGFEDQLGRLLAVHAFQVGKVALLASRVSNRHSQHWIDGRAHRSERAVYRDYEVERHQRYDRNRREARSERSHRRNRNTKVVEVHFHDDRRRPCSSLHQARVHPDQLRHQRLSRGDEQALNRWLRHERRRR